MTNRSRRFWNLALPCLLVCSNASAQPKQPPPPAPRPTSPAPKADDAIDPKKEEARAHFEKAITLFEDGAWDAALAEFLKGREIFPTRGGTKDAAICLQKLHRFDESLDMYEALEKEFPNLSADDRALADHAIADLRGLVGTIDVRAIAGAQVTIDQRVRGTVPLSPIRVSTGTRFVRVYKSGFAPFEARVEVVGGQVIVVNAKISELVQSGRLRVSEAAGEIADVVIDGTVVGKTPWEGALAPGRHIVLLRGDTEDGTPPAEVKVVQDQVTPVVLVSEKLDASVRVEPTPSGANVAIDGVNVGNGLWEGRLRSGTHAIEIGADGFLTQTRQVTLTSGDRQVVSATLERDPNSAVFRAANPPRIVFSVDGALAVAMTGVADSGLGLGPLARVHIGYEAGWGLGVALSGGYFSAAQSVSSRSFHLSPTGFNAYDHTLDESTSLRGALLGIDGSFHRGKTTTLTGRIGVGMLIGGAKDTRSGTLPVVNPTPPAGSAPTYAASATTSQSAISAYVAPEIRVGYRVAEHVEIDIGAALFIIQSISRPKWDTSGSPITSTADGQVTMPSDPLTKSTLVVISPSVGARFDF
jgi:PEGA domain